MHRYILDKLAIQAGLETQKQLMAKIDEANARIQTLEEELEQLKAKDVLLDDTVKAEPEEAPPAPEEAPPAPENEQ